MKVGEPLGPVEVVFCGNSIYLCGLAAGLQPTAELRIRLVDNTLDKAIPELKMLRPHVIIAESLDPAWVNVLRNTNPGLLLIGIEAATDSLRVFTGEQPVFPVEELARIILQYADRNGY